MDISFLCKYIKVCLPKANRAETGTGKTAAKSCLGTVIINMHPIEKDIFKQLVTLEIKIPCFYFFISKKEERGLGNSI